MQTNVTEYMALHVDSHVHSAKLFPSSHWHHKYLHTYTSMHSLTYVKGYYVYIHTIMHGHFDDAAATHI